MDHLGKVFRVSRLDVLAERDTMLVIFCAVVYGALPQPIELFVSLHVLGKVGPGAEPLIAEFAQIRLVARVDPLMPDLV